MTWLADGAPLDEYLCIDLDVCEGDIDALLHHRQDQLDKWTSTGRVDNLAQEIMREIRADIRKTRALKNKTLIHQL